MADKRLVIGLSVATGNSVAELEKVKDAAVKFGKDGAANADILTRQLENVENAAERVARKINQGKTVTVADTNAMAQSFAQLDSVIKKAFGSIENAPKEIQAAFRQAEGQVSAVRKEVINATQALEDNRDVTKQAGESWSGLGPAIEKAAGPMGATVGRLGLIAAAFKTGWDWGMKLNAFFGVDMQMWEQTVKTVGSRMLVIVQSLGENLMGTFRMVKEFLSGNFKEAGVLMDQLAETNAESQRRIRAALTSSNEEWNRYAKTIGIVTEEQRASEEAAKRLAEEKAKLAQKIADVVAALQAETLELEKQKNASIDAEHGLINRSDQLGYYKRTLDAATDAVRTQRAEVEELTKRYGAQAPMTVQAAEQLAVLQTSLAYAEQSYKTTGEEVKRYEEAQKRSEAAMKASEERSKRLTEEHSKLSGSTATLSTAQGTAATQAGAVATAADQAATATTKQATAATTATPAVSLWRDELGKVHITSSNVVESSEKAAAAIGKVAEATAGLSFADAVSEAERMASAVERIVTALNGVPSAAHAASAAIRETGRACAEAAGTEEAGGGGGW